MHFSLENLANNGHFFNSEEVETLIGNYQRSQSVELMGEIVMRCRPLSLSLIRSRRSFCFEDEAELLSRIDRKILVSIPQFDRSRGSAFSFISRLSLNSLCTAVTLQKKLSRRYQVLDEAIVSTTADDRANFASTIALDDLAGQIRRLIKSPCTEPIERETQRWFTESFLNCEFSLRRHEVCRAAVKVYGITPKRARELHDLTLMNVRQVVYTEMRHSPINQTQLQRSKDAALLRFINFVTPEEFAKFVALMHHLPPSVIVRMPPERKAGSPETERTGTDYNQLFSPSASRLFRRTNPDRRGKRARKRSRKPR